MRSHKLRKSIKIKEQKPDRRINIRNHFISDKHSGHSKNITQHNIPRTELQQKYSRTRVEEQRGITYMN